MRKHVYHILYSIMFVMFIGMVLWLLYSYDGKSIVEESFPEAVDFATGWVTEDGTPVDTVLLRSLEGTELYKEFGIYNRIPENLEEGQYLCFRSKNIFYKVYFDDELVYDPYVPQNKLYTKSFGTRWNYVPISMEDAGKQIEIRITKVYESARSSVDNLYIGQPARVIMDTIEEKLVAFITCILLLFVGLLLIVADIPINMQAQKNHELLYLGFFSVSVAIWCLAETHLLPYYIGDSRMMQIVSCYSLMLIPIPMILYLDVAFGFRKRGVVAAMVGISFASFVINIVLHLTGIKDLHESLNYTHAVLVMSAVALFYMIVRDNNMRKGKSTKNVFHILRSVGLCGLSFTALIDLWRYYSGAGNDSAMFVRIGLLFFIICFGSSSLEKTINAVKLGARAEFVSQLAYQDGLTGIGNRTAFEERLAELEELKTENAEIGILMMDVNDLKYMNDNLGHHTGDDMIVESARLIQEAFLPEGGECFRIGGDEFVVFLCGEQVEERYKSGIRRFADTLKQYNEQPDSAFRISIAHGFAMCGESQNDLKIVNIYQKADALMYENKKQIKETQISPQQYYRERIKKDNSL